jgi:hypothetical protein
MNFFNGMFVAILLQTVGYVVLLQRLLISTSTTDAVDMGFVHSLTNQSFYRMYQG